MSKLVALVTGSCTGIGFGIVEELLRRGVDTVYMTGHIEQQGNEAIKNLKDKGLNPEFHILDVTDENSVKTCAEFIKNKHGGLNILVNNAGVITSDWEKTTYEDAVRVIGVNYKGIVNVEKYFFPILKENARVVNIGSDQGHISNLKNSHWIEKLISKDLTHKDVDEFVDWYLESVRTGTWKAEDFVQTAMLSYKVSKIAVCALSRVQQKVVDKNISVNAIHPGYVKTGFTNWTGYMTPEEANEELVFRDRWGGLTLFNVRNFTTRLLMNNSTFRELNAVDFKVSADLKFVLLISDVRPGWRHARLARYHVYDVINRNKIPISPVEDDRSAPLLQYAEWSPLGASLVFVHDNDIFYKPRVLKTLVCRITNNGVPGTIFNGVPDFLYESQVLRLDRALWFSPDGQILAYVSYNDSLVDRHQYPWYGLDETEPPAYPSIRTLRYPKVNTNNPVATVYVVSLKTPKFLFPHAIQFTPQIDKDWYVRWTGWISERQLAVLLLNRAQNVTVISVCSAANYNCQDIIRDETDGSRWSGLGAEPDPECGWCGGSALLGGRGGLFTSAPMTDRGGAWRHAVRIGADGKAGVTQGPFEISQMLGWDEGRKLLYVMGTAPEKPGERHLYRASTEESAWPAPAQCLTCPGAAPLPADAPASSEPPQELENATSALPAWPTSTVLPLVADENDSLPAECLYNRVTFSRNFSYYVQECLGPGPPAIFLCSANGERRAVLWDGAPLRQKFAALAVPQAKVFRVEVQADREARVRLYLPPGFRETDDLPLPLVLHVSAEPGGQLVTERWAPGWGWYLAAARNFIVAEIDARGSGGQGEELRTEVYHKLLSVDVEDQIAVLSYLRDNLKMVDGSRVGVWGRGYGAGAAAALVADDARNVTRCLAAVAPVTDLRHYNSFWTERYGGYGAHWAGALGASAVWRKAGNLPPRRLFLAHATADLAAPQDHALALARALIRTGAVYTHQIYPDEGHNFERSKIHLHKAMEQFFDECFGPVEVADWDVGGVGGLFPFRD